MDLNGGECFRVDDSTDALTKEDIKNYADLVYEADYKEVQSFVKNKIFKAVHSSKVDVSVIDAIWVRRWKRMPDGSLRKIYSGQWKQGLMAGRGQLNYDASKDVYIGEWHQGQRAGVGICTYGNGDVYEGEYKAGKKEGRGTYTFANGEADTVRFAADAPVGEGARWSADRQSAWRLRDGKKVESISLEEAARIAAAES